MKRLIDLGLISVVPDGRIFWPGDIRVVGQKGAYTRKKGLDREQNLALLLKHIEANKATGSKLVELCQVLPALASTHVQSLLRTLKRQGKRIRSDRGVSASGFPGLPHLR